MKKSKNLLSSKGLLASSFAVAVLTAFILAGSEQQRHSASEDGALESVALVTEKKVSGEEILQQVTRAQLDQPHLAEHRKGLEAFCHLHTGECLEFVKANLAQIFNWDIQKILFLLEVVIMGNDVDYSLVDHILGFKPSDEAQGTEHGDEGQQVITITKTVALQVFKQKLEQGATSEGDNEQFKQDLIQLASEEPDLMLVRNALLILKQSFAFEKNEIQQLVGHRDAHDTVAYQDLL